MIVSIHQPDYIPYIGYFYKIAQSDIFVFLDDVQFSRNNMHHWNRIKTSQGECRLKIPVDYNSGDYLNQVRTKDELHWKSNHLKTIELNYTRGKYFKEVFPKFQEIMLRDYKSLADMNIAINTFLCDGFGLKQKLIRSSDLFVKSAKEERIIDICKILDATEYISGNGARAYQVEEHFANRGVKLHYTDYHQFEYQQLWKEFIPNLSILDYIFNYGFDWDYIDKALRSRL